MTQTSRSNPAIGGAVPTQYPATGTCFGLVDGLEREIGYFDLTELADTTVFGGVPAVERDLHWQPRTIGEIKRGSLRTRRTMQKPKLKTTLQTW